MKKYIRYLYLPNQGDREQIKYNLNDLGFYCLNGPDGLYVYAIDDTPRTLYNSILDTFKALVGVR
jgi:hypothetical protein